MTHNPAPDRRDGLFAPVASPAAPPLADVRDRFAVLAGGIDARFVAAGTALANEYAVVEQLIGALEGVTVALRGHGDESATGRLRRVAETLTRLPALQAGRRADLDAIALQGRALIGVLNDARKTLDLLRVYSLNVQVEASETGDFTDFAHQMDTKLDHSDHHVAALRDAVQRMVASIPAAHRTADRLVAECGKVIPMVPMRLDENILALQGYQADLAEKATVIAGTARNIRALVAEAITALQIGDITRQRLEHLVAGAHIVAEDPEDDMEPDALCAARDRMVRLLALQAGDAADQFRTGAGVLIDSLRRIVPEAHRLLTVSRALGSDETDHGGSAFLHRLEIDIAEIGTLTARLREADRDVTALAAATSEAAEDMVGRLAMIRRARRDVQLLALNAGFRSMRVGINGRGLTVVTTHIHDSANALDRQVDQIDTLIAGLEQGAGRLRERSGHATTDIGHTLDSALGVVREGAAHTDAELAKTGSGAAEALRMLEATIERVDCEEEITTPMLDAVRDIERLSAIDPGEPLSAAAEAHYRAMLARLAALYTMARERDVHRCFTGGEDAAPVLDAISSDGDDDLFDDALF